MKRSLIPLRVILYPGGSLHISPFPKDEEWLAMRQGGKEMGAFLFLPHGSDT